MDTGGLIRFASGELVVMIAIAAGLMLIPQLKQQNWGRILSIAVVSVIIINLLNGGQGVWAAVRWVISLVGINL